MNLPLVFEDDCELDEVQLCCPKCGESGEEGYVRFLNVDSVCVDTKSNRIIAVNLGRPENIMVECPNHDCEHQGKIEDFNFNFYPWNLHDGDEVTWTDPDGGHKHTYTVMGNVSYSCMGQEDCVIGIATTHGSYVECWGSELS